MLGHFPHSARSGEYNVFKCCRRTCIRRSARHPGFVMADGLLSFYGTDRRFQKGVIGGVTITTTTHITRPRSKRSARGKNFLHKMYGVSSSHTPTSRLRHCLMISAEALSLADKIVPSLTFMGTRLIRLASAQMISASVLLQWEKMPGISAPLTKLRIFFWKTVSPVIC